MVIKDQQNDISKAFIIKTAGRMTNLDLAKQVLDLAMDETNSDIEFEKTAGLHTYAWPEAYKFPVDSAEDVVLSRVYFNGQREKLAADLSDKIDNQLKSYEALYGIDEDFSLRGLHKVAHVEDRINLLPEYYVVGEDGLRQAGKEFMQKYAQLSISDRVEFSENFVKEAEERNIEVPYLIDAYAGNAGCNKSRLMAQLGFRKIAAERRGASGTLYEQLAAALENGDFENATAFEKTAMVASIEDIDEKCGLIYSKHVPDAWTIVFNKYAEESDIEDNNTKDGAKSINNYTKADIIGRYGEDALQEVEDDNGEIDMDKLKNLVKIFGGDKKEEENKIKADAVAEEK